jgi:hypothetical protein
MRLSRLSTSRAADYADDPATVDSGILIYIARVGVLLLARARSARRPLDPGGRPPLSGLQ